jgi:hypothetical protein
MKKNIIYRILTLIYIGAMVISVIIMIKPGASIFYFKKTINLQSIKPDSGFAYRYPLNFNPLTFRTPDILLYEDGHQLNKSESRIVVEVGTGTYALSEPSSEAAKIYFSSSDNSDPKTNGKKYTLFIPLNSISHTRGIWYLEILSPGLIWFLIFIIANPERRKTLVKSPTGILMVLDQFFEHGFRIFASDTGKIGQQIKDRVPFWKQLFAVTILATFFYIFMEWLFFVTKPSFMSILSPSERFEILNLSALALSILSMVVLAVYLVLDIIAVVARHSRLTQYLGVFIPGVILSGLALILIDNFTYTVFKFGISTSGGVWRSVYGLLFLVLGIYIHSLLFRYFGLKGKEITKRMISNRLFFFTLGVLVISISLGISRLDFSKLTKTGTTGNSRRATSRPNIILLGSDGLTAGNLSVYGYERDTTPQLRVLADSSMVAENAFSNYGESLSSVTSILTGKLPTTTRVGLSSDILTGLDAYQHLPGILKDQGYKTVELGVPFYVDAYSTNMQNGFDVVNDRSQSTGILVTILKTLGFNNALFFMGSLNERISDRILYIFYIRDMQNPYDLVTKPESGLNDNIKISQMLDLFDQIDQPLFIHVHLMGTHGPKFAPPVHVFSKGEQQDQKWMVDYYDDAIHSFDNYIAEVIKHLKKIGQYENTILIIYTDHDMMWQVNKRIPLMIHFPGDRYAGRISQNAQNLDIAPTVLDYLGLPVPGWMSGESLLKSNLDAHRLIFASGPIGGTNSSGTGHLLSENQPPFYEFAFMNIFDCQKWYRIDLNKLIWTSGEVTDYIDPCAPQSLLSFNEIEQALVKRLDLDGFDTSSLP